MRTLLIIDPQNDFCDPTDGSLYVPGADHDMQRIAGLISCSPEKIFNITVTLDTHNILHCANTVALINKDGEHPEPFTIVTPEDIRNQIYRPVDGNDEKFLHYLTALEAVGRKHVVWPTHCLIGTWGHNISKSLQMMLMTWSCITGRSPRWLLKGLNNDTEHFSAVKAEIPTDDPATHINNDFVESFKNADEIVVCGEALSHCVQYTVRDLSCYAKQMVLLKDCCSVVPGFEQEASSFLEDMQALGMRVMMSHDYREQLLKTS